MAYELEMLILTNFEFYIPEIFMTVNLLLLILYSIINANKSSGIYRFKQSIKNYSLINITITLLILILIKFNITSDINSITGGLLMTND
jgi:hypothetical protein